MSTSRLRANLLLYFDCVFELSDCGAARVWGEEFVSLLSNDGIRARYRCIPLVVIGSATLEPAGVRCFPVNLDIVCGFVAW